MDTSNQDQAREACYHHWAICWWRFLYFVLFVVLFFNNQPMGVKCSELLVLEFGVTLEGLKGEYQYF